MVHTLMVHILMVHILMVHILTIRLVMIVNVTVDARLARPNSCYGLRRVFPMTVNVMVDAWLARTQFCTGHNNRYYVSSPQSVIADVLTGADLMAESGGVMVFSGSARDIASNIFAAVVSEIS